MSTNYSTKKQPYHHLSEVEHGTVKPVNGKKIYYEEYFAETAQIRYSEGRKGSYQSEA